MNCRTVKNGHNDSSEGSKDFACLSRSKIILPHPASVNFYVRIHQKKDKPMLYIKEGSRLTPGHLLLKAHK